MSVLSLVVSDGVDDTELLVSFDEDISGETARAYFDGSLRRIVTPSGFAFAIAGDGRVKFASVRVGDEVVGWWTSGTWDWEGDL